MTEPRCVLLAVVFMLAGCGAAPQPDALGTLEWDQIELVAEASEPVLEILVAEGDMVEANTVLLRLDDRRARAELARAEAERTRLEAVLGELRHGARHEAITESRARLARARSLALNAQQDFQRVQGMRERRLASASDLDRAQATAAAARAEQRGAEAALEQLLAGTRDEQLAQAEAAVAAARAGCELLAISLQRLTVMAPRVGQIDALPVEVGDQPPRGATLVSLMVGTGPHARVFIPARMRDGLAPGAAFEVRIEGHPNVLAGRLRHVSTVATFTPYYALAGDDASRLSYLATIDLQGAAIADLPAGVPVTATRVDLAP